MLTSAATIAQTRPERQHERSFVDGERSMDEKHPPRNGAATGTANSPTVPATDPPGRVAYCETVSQRICMES